MQKKYLPVCLLFAILLLTFAFLGVKNGEAAATFSLADEEKRVYLTFDDGPSTLVTNNILDTLKREKVKATFFIVSDRARSRKKTLLRIAEEGHTLGVHSASHEYQKIYRSDESFLEDVEECSSLIRSVTGITPAVYRFPGGGLGHEPHLSKLLGERGFRVVSWNAVCGDEEIPNASADALYEEAVKTSAGKSSITLLLHDSASHRNTAEALPRIIDYFRRQGYVFCAY